MKRVLMGVVWFVVFFIVLYIIFSVVVAYMALHGAGIQEHTGQQQMINAAMAFSQAHTGALSAWRLIILVVSIILAVAGTLKGVLPGTRKLKVTATPQ